MPTVDLVPLGLGELLDRIFSTFRKHFWLFAGIMVFPQALLVALNISVQIFLGTMTVPARNPHSPQAAAQVFNSLMRVGRVSLGILIPYFVVYALALGAVTWAVSEVYLGRTTSIRESYKAVRRRVGRILHVIFSIGLRAFTIFFLGAFSFAMVIAVMATTLPKSLRWVVAMMAIMAFVGFVLGGVATVLYLMRYSVAIPALVAENLTARQALKRSVALSKGYLWRLLIAGGLMWVVSMTVVSLCQSPFMLAALMIGFRGGRPGLWLTIPSLLVGGAGAVATAPLFMISFAIAYYDLRVRKEGFDLQLMMSNLEGTAPSGATGQKPEKPGDSLADSSVFGVILLTVFTAGIYPPIWFLTRRRAFNNLHSPEKLGLGGLLVALALLIVSACFPFVGGAKWGSWVQAENALGPAHPLLLMAAGIILIVECFRVRRILLDHLAPREEGMFSASIRFQYDDLLSRVRTFSLGIFYLQYKINCLIDRLKTDENSQAELLPGAIPASPFPPVLL